MSSNYHTPHTDGPAQLATAARFNGPLGELDAAIGTAIAQAQAAQTAVLLNGTAVMSANGAANAAQKVVTVDSSTAAVAGARVEYTLVGGVLEQNTVYTVDSATQVTLTTNIGTGGIADNGLITVIPVGFYNARVGIFNVLDYGSAVTATTIAAAVAAAETAGRGIVVIPDGDATVDTQIDIASGIEVRIGNGTLTAPATGYLFNVTADGAKILGSAETTIDLPSGNDGAVLLDGSAVAAGIQGCVVRNLTIHGQTGSTDGMYVKWAFRNSFENIAVPRCVNAGIYLDGAILNTFTNCHVSTNLPVYGLSSGATPRYGIYAALRTLHGVNMDVNANTFIGCHFEGITTSPGVGVYFAELSTNNVFIGGTSEGNTIGIDMPQYSRNVFIGFHLEANTASDFDGGIMNNVFIGKRADDTEDTWARFPRLMLGTGALATNASLDGDAFGNLLVRPKTYATYLSDDRTGGAAYVYLGGNAAGASSYLIVRGGSAAHEIDAMDDGHLYIWPKGHGYITLPDASHNFYVRDHAAANIMVLYDDKTAGFGGNVRVTGNLGVGNSAAGSSLGTCVKKMEVFDAAGNSLGYVPIYDAIT